MPVGHIGIVEFRFGFGLLSGVDDRGEVRFDGDAAVIAFGEKVAQNPFHASVAISAIGIDFISFNYLGVFDMNIDYVLVDVKIVFPRILAIRDRVAGVEHDLERRAVDLTQQNVAVLVG